MIGRTGGKVLLGNSTPRVLAIGDDLHKLVAAERAEGWNRRDGAVDRGFTTGEYSTPVPPSSGRKVEAVLAVAAAAVVVVVAVPVMVGESVFDKFCCALIVHSNWLDGGSAGRHRRAVGAAK